MEGKQKVKKVKFEITFKGTIRIGIDMYFQRTNQSIYYNIFTSTFSFHRTKTLVFKTNINNLPSIPHVIDGKS